MLVQLVFIIMTYITYLITKITKIMAWILCHAWSNYSDISVYRSHYSIYNMDEQLHSRVVYWLIFTSPHISIFAHDDVNKWKHFPCYWPLLRGIHRSPVNFPHKSQWRGASIFSLIYAWTNSWVNNQDANGLRRHCAHYDVTVIISVANNATLHSIIHWDQGNEDKWSIPALQYHISKNES